VNVTAVASSARMTVGPRSPVVLGAPDRAELFRKQRSGRAYLDISENGGGTTLTARRNTAKIEITKLGDDVVAGTIDFGVDEEDETMAKGAFTAKVCPPEKEE